MRDHPGVAVDAIHLSAIQGASTVSQPQIGPALLSGGHRQLAQPPTPAGGR
jgi:hypothetical protein